MESTVEKLGRKPRYVMFFRDLEFPLPADVLKAHPEYTFIISLELHHWRGDTRDCLEAIARGDYDDFFRRWALDAIRAEVPFYLRFGFEMSGTWFPWGGRPELFRNAWRRVHDIFRGEGADNVRWLFSPNILHKKGMSFEKDYLPYWPGDAYVDMVGLDGYNFGDNYDKYHRWRSYQEIFEASIAAASRFGKPLILAEIGCADDPRKAAWTRDFLERVSRDPRVRGFIWFNFDKRREKEPNWALDSDPETLEVFRNWLTGGRSAGPGRPLPPGG